MNKQQRKIQKLQKEISTLNQNLKRILKENKNNKRMMIINTELVDSSSGKKHQRKLKKHRDSIVNSKQKLSQLKRIKRFNKV